MPRVGKEENMARATSAQEVFDAIPGRVSPETLKGVNAKVLFDLSGEGGGQWVLDIADGVVSAATGSTPNPNVTLATSASDYLAIVNGELNPMNAFMQGKIKVKGDMALMLKLQSLLGGR
jgi:putative sterol carrier protein